MKSKHECQLIQNSMSHLPKLLPNDSAFAKIKRSIRKSLLVSARHPEVYLYLKSNAAIEKESKRQVESNYWVIHPLSKFRKYWNILIFVVVILHQLLTAFSIGFFMDLSDDAINKIFLTDMLLCLILWIEIIASFRTGYIVTETNQIILDPKTIAKKYARYFIPDLFTSLPYIHILALLLHYEENKYLMDLTTIALMLILYCLSIYLFGRHYSYFTSVPIILDLSEKTVTIFKTCLRSFHLLHWTACIRKFILYYVQSDLKEEVSDVWRNQREMSKFHVRRLEYVEDWYQSQNIDDAIQNDALFFEEVTSNYTVFNKYTRSIMITLKLSLQAGYGAESSDTVINMLLTTFIMFVGWIYCTYVLILMSNIIFASAISKNKYQEIMNDINVFAESKGLSEHLTEKMRTYIERKFQKRYFNEEAINMNVQSTACLKKEIIMHSCSHLVAKVPLFKNLPTSLLEDIISCLTFEIYFPNEIIIEANAVGDSMYFIAYGTAVVISTTGQKLQTLQDGSYFGEIALLIKGQKRTATVKSLETCEVYKLSQNDFRKVIEPHQDVVRKIEEMAKDRLRKMFQKEHDLRKSGFFR